MRSVSRHAAGPLTRRPAQAYLPYFGAAGGDGNDLMRSMRISRASDGMMRITAFLHEAEQTRILTG